MKIEIISLGKFKKNPPLKIVFDYYKKRINLNVDFISKPAKLKLEKSGVTINLKQKI